MALSDLLGAGAGQVLENLSEMTDKYIDLEKIIPSITNLFVDQAEELRKLNKELGTGNKTVARFSGEIGRLSKQIGVSTRDVTEFLSSTNKYHQGIIKSTKSTLMFSKAVGEIPSSLGDFSAKLTILGHTSEENFTKMYENILGVRNAFGLTSEQIDNVIAITTKYAVVTNATTEQIENATLSISKFTSQLTAVGIETSRVTDILDGMLDPDKLMDNVVLMNKLGISVNDMISGDPTTKLEGSAERLKQLGQEIMNISKTNRMQANEMAKVYGITLEEARQFAEIDTSDKAIDTQKKLEQYQSEMQTFTKSIESLKNMIGGAISGPLSFIGDIIQTFTDTISILPKGIIALFTGVGMKLIINKIAMKFGERIGQAARKWGEKFSEPMKEYLTAAGKRSGEKQADLKAASSSLGENGKNPEGILGKIGGIGVSNYFKQIEKKEKQTNAKSERIAAKLKQKGEYNYAEGGIGAVLEELQERVKQADAIKKAIEKLEKGGMADQAKAKLYRQKYENIVGPNGFIETFNNIIADSSIKKQLSWGADFSEKVTNYKTAKNKGLKTMAGNRMIESFSKDYLGGEDALTLNTEDRDKVASVLGDENVKGPRDALIALKELFEQIGTKEAENNIAKIDAELEKMNEEADKSDGLLNKSTEALKGFDKALANSEKKIRGEKFKAAGQGLISRAGNVFGMPLGWWGILIKSVIGIAGFIGGIAKKNEKVIKATEKIRKVLDNFKQKVTTWLEPFTNVIANAIDKVASWLGGTSGDIKDINENVSTISDSYKQEDLATMHGGVAYYDSMTNTLGAKLDDMYYIMYDFRRVVKDGMNTANDMAAYQLSS